MPFTQTFNINEMVNCIQLRTIKDIQVKRIDVKPSIVVVVEDMAGGINMGARVRKQLHHRHISNGAILHAIKEPEELPQPIHGVIRGHVRGVSVSNVNDSTISIHFTPRWNQSVGVPTR